MSDINTIKKILEPQKMKVELYIPDGTEIVQHERTGFNEPDFDKEGKNLAWILYRMANSDGITAVVNKACELYGEDIKSGRMRTCISQACRNLVIEYLEETGQI